jgi:hypothetical protein
VPADHFINNCAHKSFHKIRVKTCTLPDFSESGELQGFSACVSSWQMMCGFELTHFMRAAETLSKDMDKRSVEIIDRQPIREELCLMIMRTHCFTSDINLI